MGLWYGAGRVRCLRLLSLLVACIAYLFWGSVTTTTYYANAIKIQYNFSQPEVETLIPVLAVGKVLSPFPAAVYQRYGATPTIAVGVSVTSIGYLLVSEIQVQFFQRYPILLYTCFCLMGVGRGFFNMGLLTVTAVNFGPTNRGKAVSVLLSSYGLSPLVSLFIYRQWFAHGVIENDADQDVSGFFLFGAISSASTGAFCLLLVRVYDSDESDFVALNMDGTDDEDIMEFENKRALPAKWSETCKGIASWPLQMTVWSFCLTYTIYVGLDANLAVYAKSAEIYDIFDNCFFLLHITVFLTQLAIGFMSDALLGVIPNMLYTSVTSSMLTVCLCVALLFPTDRASFYLVSVTTGLAGGVIWPIVVKVLMQEWGEKKFAKYWGWTYCLASLCLAAWLAVFSWLYQRAIGRPGELDCYGNSCLRWVNVVSFVMMTAATIFNFSLALIKKF